MKATFDEVFAKAQGNYFLALRKENKLTIEKVSNELGISKMAYCLYEKGERNMSISTFRKLCLFYKLDYVQVFDDVNGIADFDFLNKQNV